MSGFEIYFSFYGLLLGLSVAQVANGIGHAVVTRKTTTLGLFTPLLAVFILLDIASFWVWAWMSRDVIQVNYASINLGLIVALAYYIATVLLFPLASGVWDKLDEHYWNNKRFVISGVMVANAIVVGHGIVTRPELLSLPRFWLLQPLYWLPLGIMLFSHRRPVDLICLAILIVGYVVTSVTS
jgi:hypothetical protein